VERHGDVDKSPPWPTKEERSYCRPSDEFDALGNEVVARGGKLGLFVEPKRTGNAVLKQTEDGTYRPPHLVLRIRARQTHYDFPVDAGKTLEGVSRGARDWVKRQDVFR
jgi:hypothetical protein